MTPALRHGPRARADSHEPDDALAPVRRALLADAQTEADRVLADAQADADRIVADAEAEVAAAVAQAERRAAASARAHADHELRSARRRANAEVLAARLALWNDLVSRVRAAVGHLPDDPRYPVLLDHLATLAREQLGDAATITVVPPPDGGLVADAGPRQVDYRLTALADRALAAVTDEGWDR